MRSLALLRKPSDPATTFTVVTGVSVADLDQDGLDDVAVGTLDDVTVLLGGACAPGSPLAPCRAP